MEDRKTYNPTVSQSFFLERREGKNLLTHRNRRAFVVVNDSGLEIIRLMDGSRSIDDISKIIAGKYGVNSKTVREDVLNLIRKLEESGFLDNNNIETMTGKCSPESLSIHITDKCNLSCLHCYNESSPSSLKELSFEKIKELIECFKKLGGESLTLTGGDPLLHPHFQEILKMTKRFKHVSVLTNGTNIDSNFAKLLNESGARIQISLDGSTAQINDRIRGKGAFKKIGRGIEYLKKNGAGDKIVISATAMRQNIRNVPAIIELAEGMGIKNFRCLPLRREGCADKNRDEISSGIDIDDYYSLYREIDRLREIKKGKIDIETGFGRSALNMQGDENGLSCPVGKTFTVYARGDVFPCPVMMDEIFCVGNVYEMPLDVIINSTAVSTLRKSCAERKEKIKKCSLCLWKNFCEGGCAAIAYLQKGTIEDADDFCGIRKEFLGKSLWGIVSEKG